MGLIHGRALPTTLCLVLQANVCSTFIPVYCGLIPPTLQGVVSISAWPCPGMTSIIYCLWAVGTRDGGERPLGHLSPSSVPHSICCFISRDSRSRAVLGRLTLPLAGAHPNSMSDHLLSPQWPMPSGPKAQMELNRSARTPCGPLCVTMNVCSCKALCGWRHFRQLATL